MNQANLAPTSTTSAAELVQLLRERADKPNDAFEIADTIVEGNVDLNSLSFAPKIVFRNCVFRGHFDASEAYFAKSLTLAGCRFEDSVRFFGARIGGQLRMDDVAIRGVPKEGASFEQLDVTGNLIAVGIDTDGRLNFRGAHIDGQLDLSGGRLAGDLSLQNARIAGNLFCRPRDGKRTTIEGNAWLFGVQVGDLVEMSGSSIGGDLLMEDAVLKGGLFCRPHSNQRTEIAGQVWLTGARVSGTIDLGGAKIGGDVLGESAEIKGGFYCRTQDNFDTEIGGRLWLSAVKIASQLSISGAKIGGNFVVQHAEIEGGVVGHYKTQIGGEVWMVGTKVDGGVDFTSLHVAKDMYLQNARFDDLALRSDGEQRVVIGGSLDIEAAEIGRLELDGRATLDRPVRLTLAKVTHLNVQHLPISVELEGFQFQQLTLPKNNYLGWLAASVTFQSSTYWFMENWLRNHGDHANANRVYLAMRRRDRQQGRKGVFRRAGDWFLDKSVGYGIHFYRPLIFYFVPVVILSVFLFSDRLSVQRNVSHISPIRADISISPTSQEWEFADALAVALQINLPMVNLIVDDDWEPSSNKIVLFDQQTNISYQFYALIVSLLSWIAIPLFVVGMSGVLKKET